MFQVGEFIFYDRSGVCRVESIGPLKEMHDVDQNKVYYKLSLLRSTEIIYIPVETSVFMRPILTREQVHALIDQLPSLAVHTCNPQNLRLLFQRYQAAFDTRQCEDLLQVMKTIYAKSQLPGKQLSLIEQKYQKQAEKLVYGEFSVALGISFEAVPQYIKARIARLEAH